MRRSLVLAAFGALAAFVLVLAVLSRPRLAPPPGPDVPSSIEDPPPVSSPTPNTAFLTKPVTAGPPRTGAPASRPAGIRMTGRVTALETGEAVAKARVSIHRSALGEQPVELISVLTSPDGHYELSIEPNESDHFLQARVWKKGFARVSSHVGIGEIHNDSIRQDFELPAGGLIAGRVIDSGGYPVEGASVGSPGIFGVKANGDRKWIAGAEATTDAAGAFQVEGLPADTVFRLPARADGYQQGVSGEAVIGDTNVEIVLKPGESGIEGEVILHDGTPLTGQRVQWSLALPEAANDEVLGYFARGIERTDNNGRFAVRDLPATPATVALYSPGRIMVEEKLSLKPGQTEFVSLRVPEPVTVSGRVYNQETSEPVEGVVLGAGSITRGKQLFHDALSSQMETGRDGKYRLKFYPGKDDSSLTVMVNPQEGWVLADKPLGSSLSISLPVNSTVVTRDIALQRATVLEGTVVMGDGVTPVPDARISIRAEQRGPSSGFGWEHGQADGNGRFQCDVVPGVRLRLSAHSETGSGETVVSIPASGAVDPVTIVIEQHAFVRGRVVADSEPVENAKVYVSTQPLDKSGFYSGRTFQTKADGGFEVRGRFDGRVYIAAEPPPGSMLRRSDPVAIEVAEGGGKDGIVIELSMGLFIEGVVTDMEGEPVEGASIVTMIRFGNSSRTGSGSKTDSDGYYLLGGLSGQDGLSRISAQHPDYEPEWKDVNGPEDSPVNFMLERRYAVPLRVVSNGIAVPDYEYRVLGWMSHGSTSPLHPDFHNHRWTNVSSPDGKTLTTPLYEARHIVEVRETDGSGQLTGRAGREEFNVFRGEQTPEVTVELSGNTALVGRVVNQETGQGIAEATVGLLPSGYSAQNAETMSLAAMSTNTDENGAFRFEGVPVGEWNVAAAFEEVIGSTHITVETGRVPDPVIIQMALGVPVSVVLINEFREPVVQAGFEYQVVGEYGSAIILNGTLTPDAKGETLIGELRAGDWQIFVWRGDGSIDEASPHRFSIENSDQSKTVTVSVAPLVRMEGTVTVNAATWNGEPGLEISYTHGGYMRRAALEPAETGRYRTQVRAGRVQYGFKSNHGLAGQIGTFDVSSNENPALRNIDVELVDVTVVSLFPEGQEFARGNVQLDWHYNSSHQAGGTGGYLIEMTENTIEYRNVPRGWCTARFNSFDRRWGGEVRDVPVGPGEENVIVVEVREKERQRKFVGSWDSRLLSTEFTDLRFPMDDWKTSQEFFRFELIYTEGVGSVQVAEIALEVNGAEVAAHRSPMELNPDRNRISSSARLASGTEGPAAVRVRIRTRGDGDSRGDIFAY